MHADFRVRHAHSIFFPVQTFIGIVSHSSGPEVTILLATKLVELMEQLRLPYLNKTVIIEMTEFGKNTPATAYRPDDETNRTLL